MLVSLPLLRFRAGYAARVAGPLLCAVLASASAYPASYPDKPIRMIVAAAPGGSADALARTVQPVLAEILGQPVVIDNRAGASGIIGIELAAKSQPDGYTLLLNTSTHTTLPGLNAKLPFDLLKDFAPVSLIVSQANLLVVHPSVRASTVKDLVALARAKPDALNFASGGIGTSPHLAGELLKLTTGIRITHVPYKGSGPAITDLLGGHVQMMFVGPLAIAQHIKAGRLRVLAVSAGKRSATFPEVPTMAEAGFPGVESGTWYGVVAPGNTPKAVISRLYGAIKQAVHTPELGSRLASQGVDVVASAPEQFGPYIRSEIAKWTKVVKATGVRAE
ncbi:MAG: tripartite tricarboxylate transporter substrate binding protein [Betaproteobacteria bacterium]|nr:tripartite tricarboxylate transporter substrate binding protein [Betaproteobacteria bacterium]